MNKLATFPGPILELQSMLGARPRSGVSGVTLATGPGTAVVFNTLCASHFFECNWYENVDPEISHLRGAEFSHFRGAEISHR